MLHPIAFTISLVVVVVAHMVLGEMVPKNIAIAGPERTAIWLVPPFLAFTTVMRPVIRLFNIMANRCAAAHAACSRATSWRPRSPPTSSPT